MDLVALGFLVSLTNTEGRILPQYGSHCSRSLMLKVLQALLLTRAPVPHSSRAIHLDAMFKQPATASMSPSFHISALHLTCWGTARVPLFIQHCLQKELRQPLPLLSLFLPSCLSNNNHYKTNMQHENCWCVFWQLHWKYSPFSLWMKIVSISSLTVAFRNIVTTHIVICKCGFKY